MIAGILLALSPFILSGVTALVTLVSGMNSTGGKRTVLALASLIGVIATAALTGNPLDVQSFNSLVQVLGASFVTFLMAHGSYHLFFKGSAAPAAAPLGASADLPTFQG